MSFYRNLSRTYGTFKNRLPSGFSLKEQYPYYLGNRAIQANTDLIVTDKYTGEGATAVAQADGKVIDEAIAIAVKAAPAMKELPSFRRKAILSGVALEVQKNFEAFAYSLCIEAGKPINDARGEVTRLIDTFTIAAEEAVRRDGITMELDIAQRSKGYQAIIKRFPIGPVGMISPFNFPLNLTAHKIAPAIAAGCPFVLKPASRTPIGALLLGEILSKLDMPDGAFSILPASRAGADLLTTDPRLKCLTFTGSPEVGWDMKARCGKKKIVLELGGNAGCIIDENVDIDKVVERVIFGAFYQSGQSCISVQRVYVHANVYEEFKKKVVSKASALKMGDPLEASTFIGPMIAESEAIRLEKWIKQAEQKGAKILCGGGRKGPFINATIMENVPASCDVSCQEAFGPIFVMEKFTDFKEAVKNVNNSKYGLQAGVFTKDLNKAFYAYNTIEAGGVVIGDVPSMRTDNMPYGGVKDSGLGREGVKWAIQDYTEEKLLLMKDAGNL